MQTRQPSRGVGSPVEEPGSEAGKESRGRCGRNRKGASFFHDVRDKKLQKAHTKYVAKIESPLARSLSQDKTFASGNALRRLIGQSPPYLTLYL